MRKKEGVPNPCGSHPGESYAGSHLQFRADLRRRLGKPFVIGMSDRSPFALAGLLERWRNPEAGESMQTFTVSMTDPHELCSMRSPSQRDMGANPRCGPLTRSTAVAGQLRRQVLSSNYAACGAFFDRIIHPFFVERRLDLRDGLVEHRPSAVN